MFFFVKKGEKFFERNFYFLKSLFTSSDHKILQKMGYYLIRLGSKKIIVNFEYIEKLEKKKNYKNFKNKIELNSLERLYFNYSRKFIFFD